MRILQENVAAVLIDLQEKLFPHISHNDVLLINCLKLLEGLQTLEIPIRITQQYSKGLGQTIPQISGKFEKFSFIEKNSFSCCDEPLFMNGFESLKKKNVLLFGIETHVCVLQTCLDLIEKGYIPVIVEDCVGSRKEKDKSVALERMRQEGAIISCYESILLELTRYSGTVRFKKISGIIK